MKILKQMKTKEYLLPGILIMIFSFSASLKSMAQCDEAQGKMQQSLYVEFYKQKNYKDAYKPWSYVFRNCPELSKATYAHGTRIVEKKIKEVKKDAALAQKYLDTLFMVYDQRIKYFGDDAKYPEAWILGRKANDLFRYRQKESLKEAYDCALKSMEGRGVETEASVIGTLMNSTILLYNKEEIGKEAAVNNYSKSSEIMEYLIANETKEKTKEKLIQLKDNIEELFGNCSCSDCEVIIPLFKEKFAAAPEDVELLKKITDLMAKKDCTEDQLYADASEALYKAEKSADAAYKLAKYFYKKEEFAKAAEYYNEAINITEEETDVKADYYYELAAAYLQLNSFANARTNAQKALQIRKWGEPYIVIGLAYAKSSSSCGDDFEKKTVYWAAVDKFYAAKSVDPEVADKAQKLINSYSAMFPGKEEAFFKGLHDGNDYTVGCWINEKTKVRTRK